MDTVSIMIVGVGGQGTLLASRVIGNVLLARGYDVKLSEVHGMSQRGGSVVTYVRYGEKVYSPVVEDGEADIILAFEPLEAARWLPRLKKGGTILTNIHPVLPMPVITNQAAYPSDLIAKLSGRANVIALDALALAERAGTPKAVNTVLLGRLSRLLSDIPAELWHSALSAHLKAPTPLRQPPSLLGRQCLLTIAAAFGRIEIESGSDSISFLVRNGVLHPI